MATFKQDRLTKTVIVIPTPYLKEEESQEDFGPLQLLLGKTVFRWSYQNARHAKLGSVIAATPSRVMARYCQRKKGFHWRPVKSQHATGKEVCEEIFLQTSKNAGVTTVIHWPWYRIDQDRDLLRRLLRISRRKSVVYEVTDPQGLDTFGIYPTDWLSGKRKCRVESNVYDINLPPANTPRSVKQLEALLR